MQPCHTSSVSLASIDSVFGVPVLEHCSLWMVSSNTLQGHRTQIRKVDSQFWFCMRVLHVFVAMRRPRGNACEKVFGPTCWRWFRMHVFVATRHSHGNACGEVLGQLLEGFESSPKDFASLMLHLGPISVG